MTDADSAGFSYPPIADRFVRERRDDPAHLLRVTERLCDFLLEVLGERK